MRVTKVITASASDQHGATARPPSGQPGQPCAPIAQPQRRRTLLLSVGGLAVLPSMDIASAVRSEMSLWGQEVQLYQRQLQATLKEAAPWAVPSQPQEAAAARPPIDAQLATLLLRLPLDAIEGPRPSTSQPLLPNWSRSRYEADVAVITKQELPYYTKAGACGRCSGDDLSDADWFDFQSYCQWKAIARQLPAGMRRSSSLRNGMDMLHGGSLFEAPPAPAPTSQQASSGDSQATDSTQPAAAAIAQAAADAASLSKDTREQKEPGPTPLQALQLRIGQLLLQNIGSSKGVSPGVQRVLESGNAGLDSIRAGTRGLLRYFTDQGFAVRTGIEQMGISRDEFENHEVWAAGEPAFLKVWLEQPATARSQAALEAEEGFSQDFIASTLTAYLASCGVTTEAFKRYPSYSNRDLVALQCTLRRQPGKQLSAQDAEATEFEPFVLDLCPGGDATGCY